MKRSSLFSTVTLCALAVVVAFGTAFVPGNSVKADGDIAVNKSNFPDDIFREFIINNIGNKDNVLTQEEIAQVKTLDLSSLNIEELDGIDFFTALEKLECDLNNLSNLDLTNNTNLKYVSCISNCLCSIELGNNTKLETLYCSDNELDELDVSKNTALVSLYCDGNNLTNLDTSNNDALKKLDCYANRLNQIDVSKNNLLTQLNLGKNKLKNLDVSKNTALTKLNCSENELIRIIFSKEPTDMVITCDEGVINYVLKKGEVSVNSVDFPDEGFRKFILSQKYGEDSVLTLEELNKVYDMTVSYSSENIFSLKGIEFFTSLENLTCSGYKLTDLDLQKNSALKSLDCSSSQLTSLSLNKNTLLNYLDCSNNQLTKLDLSNNTLLTDIRCSYNQITDLNVSNNISLKSLRCSGNKLSGLNTSDNVSLLYLACDTNQISSLDLQKNTGLIELFCYDNSLEKLDVRNNIALQKLNCYGNRLKNLDVSNNTALEVLNCHDNPLTDLDVKKNIALEYLECRSTQLTNLDVSKNVTLKELYCPSSQLTVLDLSNNVTLKYLICTDNPLSVIYTAKEPDSFKTLLYDKDVDIIVITGSDWKSKVEWKVNNADPSKTTATALFECTKAGATGLKISEPMKVNVTVKNACVNEGSIIYEATLLAQFSRTDKAVTDKKIVKIPATGHNWGDWKVTKKATTTSEGEETRVCKNDTTHKQTRKIDKLNTASLTLDKKEVSIVCGKTATLKATLKGSTDKITWKSSDSKVATVDSNGKITAKMAGEATITATAAGKSAECKVTVLYKDVTNTKDFWFAPTNYLTAKGVVKGYDKQTKFKPANECTRAQMVTFIWRLQGEPKPKAATCKFKDVKKSDYFYKACIWGNENHIVEGYKDGTFGPQIVCARKHAVTFLWRLANKPSPKSKTNNFKDVKSSDYFYTATIWASEKGILAGYSDNTFRPDGNCLRRQMVTFLYKYDKFVNGKG